MLNIEIDGQPVQVESGQTVMEAANLIGTTIPHFCYHKKLSIAANCRMCLVEVEKAPKPLPACATPATEGMKVHTHSPMAIKAQQGVMEFLLINHPLDCPICDQGGECQLQDIAVGYGGSASRYEEEKRVVPPKDMGPLISTDMTRCIHCTRCVRFTEEIAGKQEIGMAGRGEHSEILPFIEMTVDSEISGNVIDLCPVGALTSKPFRYSARTWELSRRRSVSPHDSLGSNLVIQVKGSRVMRALPLENEAINECWISDRDRYSYEALNSEQRLTTPMLKQDGRWHEVDWSTALDYMVRALKDVVATHGANAIGALASPQSTVEELYVLRKLLAELGSKNIDTRLRQSDFRADASQKGAYWLGGAVADLSKASNVLLVGSNIRKEQPLIAQRLRQAVKKGAQLHVIHHADEDLLCKLSSKQIVAPQSLLSTLQSVLVAAETLAAGNFADNVAAEQAYALKAEGAVVLLGQQAQNHPDFAAILATTQKLCAVTGARVGVLVDGTNQIGAWSAGAHPTLTGGRNVAEILDGSLKAVFLLHAEAEFDFYDAQKALTALGQAKMVVAMSPFKHGALDYADVLLPISPWTETAGTFINMEGRVQSFNGVVKPLAETRPAWKVFRVLGNLLDLPGFTYNSAEDVRAEALLNKVEDGFVKALDNRVDTEATYPAKLNASLTRVGEVPLYHTDGIVRRAPSLQKTNDAVAARVGVPSGLFADLALTAGAQVKVCHKLACITLPAYEDQTLPTGAVRLPAALPETLGLAGLFDAITIEGV